MDNNEAELENEITLPNEIKEDYVIQIQEKLSFIQLMDYLIKILNSKPQIIQQIKRQNVKLFENHEMLLVYPCYLKRERINTKKNIVNQNELSKIFTFFTFSQLKNLVIENINLNNCEFVSFMELPSLTNISILESKLQTLKPFIKSNLPSLKRIETDLILSKEINIERSKLPELSCIIFFISLNQKNKSKLCINLSFLVKMESNENVEKKISIREFKKITVPLIISKNKYNVNKIIKFNEQAQ